MIHSARRANAVETVVPVAAGCWILFMVPLALAFCDGLIWQAKYLLEPAGLPDELFSTAFDTLPAYIIVIFGWVLVGVVTEGLAKRFGYLHSVITILLWPIPITAGTQLITWAGISSVTPARLMTIGPYWYYGLAWAVATAAGAFFRGRVLARRWLLRATGGTAVLGLLYFFAVLSAASPGEPMQIAEQDQKSLIVPLRQLAEPVRSGAAVCTGFHPYSTERLWGMPEGNCDPAEAAFGTFPMPRISRVPSAAVTPLKVACCPLPSDDILTDIHVFADVSCPDQFVATSGTYGKDFCPSCTQAMRCTGINTERYQLGPATAGIYWGGGSKFWKQPKRLLWTDLPVAIRYGLARIGKHLISPLGCTGYPFGSLLVKKTGKQCSSHFYRQLQYRGRQGDPPGGTPVEMFPECKAIDGVYTGEGACIN